MLDKLRTVSLSCLLDRLAFWIWIDGFGDWAVVDRDAYGRIADRV